MRFVVSGQIRHEDYLPSEDLFWQVNSNCETVHIISTFFKTQTTYKSIGYYDKVTIDEIEYSGEQKVNQIVRSLFTIHFKSTAFGEDEGFILNWTCTEWGEWNQALDGTCTQEKRPVNNGTKTIGHLKTRSSHGKCGKTI